MNASLVKPVYDLNSDTEFFTSGANGFAGPEEGSLSDEDAFAFGVIALFVLFRNPLIPWALTLEWQRAMINMDANKIRT